MQILGHPISLSQCRFRVVEIIQNLDTFYKGYFLCKVGKVVQNTKSDFDT